MLPEHVVTVKATFLSSLGELSASTVRKRQSSCATVRQKCVLSHVPTPPPMALQLEGHDVVLGTTARGGSLISKVAFALNWDQAVRHAALLSGNHRAGAD